MPTPTSIFIHELSKGQKREYHERLTEILALAFQDDPLFNFLLKPRTQKTPQNKNRFKNITLFFRVMVKNAIRKGDIHIVSTSSEITPESIQVVSIWFTQKNAQVSVFDMILAGAWKFAFSSMAFRLIRLIGLLDKVDHMHESRAPNPHYYLSILGAHPDAKGKGFTAALIRKIHSDCDTQHIATYLETMNSYNVPIYEHLGYKVIEQIPIEKLGLNVWGLVRISTAMTNNMEKIEE